MKPSKYILFALFMLAFLPAFSGDIRMGIAPNPANNQVSVSIDGTTNGGQQHPEIYTLLGEKVSAAFTFIFNTSAIPDGIYLVRYGNGEQAVVKQLKIQHQ